MQVKLSVFWDYAKAMGLYTTVAICVLYPCQTAAAIGANVWLSAWTNEAMVDSRQNNTSMRLGVYAALGVLQGERQRSLEVIFLTSGLPDPPNPALPLSQSSWPLPCPSASLAAHLPLGILSSSRRWHCLSEPADHGSHPVSPYLPTPRPTCPTPAPVNTPPPPPTGILVMLAAVTLTVGSVHAARSLHQALLHNKMRSPQSFFDTTPSGRILNRFSKDIYVIDEVLAPTILMLLNSFYNSLATLVVIVASTPLFTVVTLPLGIFYVLMQVRSQWVGEVLVWAGLHVGGTPRVGGAPCRPGAKAGWALPLTNSQPGLGLREVRLQVG